MSQFPQITPDKVLADIADIPKKGIFVAIMKPDGNIAMAWSTMGIAEIVWIKENIQTMITETMSKIDLRPAQESS